MSALLNVIRVTFCIDTTQKIDNTSAFVHHRPWPLLSQWLHDFPIINDHLIEVRELMSIKLLCCLERKKRGPANAEKVQVTLNVLRSQHLEDMKMRVEIRQCQHTESWRRQGTRGMMTAVCLTWTRNDSRELGAGTGNFKKVTHFTGITNHKHTNNHKTRTSLFPCGA